MSSFLTGFSSFHFLLSQFQQKWLFQVCNTVQEQKCETQYMEKYEEQCSTVNEQVQSSSLSPFLLINEEVSLPFPETV